jgi:hypothetical protein
MPPTVATQPCLVLVLSPKPIHPSIHPTHPIQLLLPTTRYSSCNSIHRYHLCSTHTRFTPPLPSSTYHSDDHDHAHDFAHAHTSLIDDFFPVHPPHPAATPRTPSSPTSSPGPVQACTPPRPCPRHGCQAPREAAAGVPQGLHSPTVTRTHPPCRPPWPLLMTVPARPSRPFTAAARPTPRAAAPRSCRSPRRQTRGPPRPQGAAATPTPHHHLHPGRPRWTGSLRGAPCQRSKNASHLKATTSASQKKKKKSHPFA